MVLWRFALRTILGGLVGLSANVVCSQTPSTGSGQAASTGSGQAYPGKPIRIVTSEAGGGAAFIARIIAQGLSSSFDQSAIVDNRGGGVIPVEIVAKAPADGYVLLAYGATVWLGPLLRLN